MLFVLCLIFDLIILCLMVLLFLLKILILWWVIFVILFFFKKIKWCVIGNNVIWFDVMKFLLRFKLIISGLFECVIIMWLGFFLFMMMVLYVLWKVLMVFCIVFSKVLFDLSFLCMVWVMVFVLVLLVKV